MLCVKLRCPLLVGEVERFNDPVGTRRGLSEPFSLDGETLRLTRGITVFGRVPQYRIVKFLRLVNGMSGRFFLVFSKLSMDTSEIMHNTV